MLKKKTHNKTYLLLRWAVGRGAGKAYPQKHLRPEQSGLSFILCESEWAVLCQPGSKAWRCCRCLLRTGFHRNERRQKAPCITAQATIHSQPFCKTLLKNAHRACLQTPGRGVEVFSYLRVDSLSFYLVQSYFSCLLPFIHLASTYHSPPTGGFYFSNFSSLIPARFFPFKMYSHPQAPWRLLP